jgi:alkaline phosphatase D
MKPMNARTRAILSPWLLAGIAAAAFGWLPLSGCAKAPEIVDEIVPDLPLPGLGSAKPAEFAYDWDFYPDRTWIGPEFWANRLQDWRLNGDRIECVSGRLPYRTLHLLSHRIGDGDDTLRASVTLGRTGSPGKKPVEAGFLIGAGAADLDYRAASLVQSAPGPDGGLLAGVNADGQLFLRSFEQLPSVKVSSDESITDLSAVQLLLTVEPVPEPEEEPEVGENAPPNEGRGDEKTEVEEVEEVDEQSQPTLFQVKLAAYPMGAQLSLDDEEDENGLSTPDPIAEVMVVGIDAEPLIGNLALFASQQGGVEGEAPPQFWFDDWRGFGHKFDEHDEHLFGPVLCAQHTLSRNVLKMTAQLPPLSPEEWNTVHLQIKQDAQWVDVASAEVLQPGWTATFRVGDWPSEHEMDYRIQFEFDGEDTYYEGTIRRDPVEQNEIVLAGFTGNHNVRHGFGRAGFPFNHEAMWFPHQDLLKQVRQHKPDVLFFSGDQLYEGASPTFADRKQPYLDYSYKWYLWCWAFGALARDIPCVTIPDDHDVYQGNLWGQGGRVAERDHNGGYVMPSEFVRMVERTQTSHLPDPWSVAPLDQGITSYYTDMVYGRISFAVLEDRKFKSGPKGLVEHDGKRPDHIIDPAVDPKSVDVEGAELLGEEQMKFLQHWVADWSGADLKAALSQTIFAAMATHHGGNLDRILMDMDSNGWPQTGRNKVLEILRTGTVLMIGGDQHLATVVHHGIKDWDDAGFSFCVPSIANFYPRAWRPEAEPAISLKDENAQPFTGSYLDGFGNHVTVYAHTNPGMGSEREPQALHDKMPGYGIVRFNKSKRNMVLECWPRWADPSEDQPYPGWPFHVEQMDNLGREPSAWLPTLRVSGMRDPVVQVIDEFENEIVYTLRMKGQSFQLPVFEEGKYTIRVGELDSERKEVLRGVRATKTNEKFLFVDL